MDSRLNNFDSLRFWAAMSVLWSHSFPITVGSEATEPLFAFSGGQTTIGTLAVAFFFTISGCLITRSFERTANPLQFVKARVLRIMPAFLIVLLLAAFVLGPLISTVSLREYFSSSDPYRYVLLQATFTKFPDTLPGMFESNPMHWVNGPLWTLRYEVACYGLVFLLGISGLLRRHLVLALYVIAVIYLGWKDQLHVSDGLKLPAQNNVLDLGTKFLAGALIYMYRPPLKASLALLCVGISIACLMFGNFLTAARTVVPYIVMFLASGTKVRLPSMTKFGDLSYGVYIYAWPVKQLVVMNSADPYWLTTAAIATPITLLLALVSWHTVEKVAIALKDDPRLSMIPDWPYRLLQDEPRTSRVRIPPPADANTTASVPPRGRDVTNT